MIWITIIAAIIPLVVKLIEWLKSRKTPITERQKGKLNSLLAHCSELRGLATAAGCKPDGELESEPYPVRRTSDEGAAIAARMLNELENLNPNGESDMSFTLEQAERSLKAFPKNAGPGNEMPTATQYHGFINDLLAKIDWQTLVSWMPMILATLWGPGTLADKFKAILAAIFGATPTPATQTINMP